MPDHWRSESTAGEANIIVVDSAMLLAMLSLLGILIGKEYQLLQWSGYYKHENSAIGKQTAQALVVE